MKVKAQGGRRSIAPTQFKKTPMAAPMELLWAIIGLLLTIGGTFLEAFVANPASLWEQQGLHPQSLGVTSQIGAVLLTGCMGGRNAAAISQIAYLALGLTGWSVFSRGGGLGYMGQPSFGYLLGFVPGAWVCGWLAFKAKPRLEALAFSCLCGLLSVHALGLVYLVITHAIGIAKMPFLVPAIFKYSVHPLPGQLAIVCAVAVLAFLLRRIMFY